MALLRFFLLAAVLIPAAPALAHHMGRPVPLGYCGGDASLLTAHVVASYFEEQMGRVVKMVEKTSPGDCVESVKSKEFPLAVVPRVAARELPGAVAGIGEAFGPPAEPCVLIMGREAMGRLEFSLVARYVEKLAGVEAGMWNRAAGRVKAGEGVKGVALWLLREAGLL